MPSIGMQELLIILAVALLFFGGRKLPELAKGLGEGLREFKKATKDESNRELSDRNKTDDTEDANRKS
jgi:sec-independent protein translocase protein TatA